MTALEELVVRQVAASTVGAVNRTVDRLADSLTEEILREPEVREQLREVVLTAFRNVWSDMQRPKEGATGGQP